MRGKGDDCVIDQKFQIVNIRKSKLLRKISVYFINLPSRGLFADNFIKPGDNPTE